MAEQLSEPPSTCWIWSAVEEMCAERIPAAGLQYTHSTLGGILANGVGGLRESSLH